MWNLLGDFDYTTKKAKLAAGSYFYNSSTAIPFWNMFDGILLRPAIMYNIDFDHTKVLTESKTIQFLKPLIVKDKESIIKDDLSDHLPLLVTIKI